MPGSGSNSGSGQTGGQQSGSQQGSTQPARVDPPAVRKDPMPLPLTGKAPRFSADPIGFRLFFDSVQELAVRAGISDRDAIEWAIRYAGSHGLGWDRVPAARSPTRTFGSFRADVLKTYPGLNDDSRFTLHDLDALVDRTSRLNHLTAELYGEFQRAFAACSGYLLDNHRLSPREASRAFLRGLPSSVHTSVINRLAIRKPDVLPDNGYDMEDIEEAVLYVLRSRDMAYRGPSDGVRSEVPSQGSSSTFDELARAMTSLTQVLAAQMQAVPHRPVQASAPQQRQPAPAPGGAANFAPRYDQRQQAPPQRNAPRTCMFCGEVGHYVAECQVVEEYIRSGMLIRNPEWKLVLPDSRFVPRHIPGATMRERVDNFYRSQGIPERELHEGRDVISTNFLEGIDESIFSVDITPVPTNPVAMNTNSSQDVASSSSSSSPSSFLAQDAEVADQIQVMEAQIASLRQEQALILEKKRDKFDGVHVPNQRKAPAKGYVPAPPKTPNIHAQPVTRIMQNPDRQSSQTMSPRVAEKQPQARPQGPIRPVEFPSKPAPEEPKFHYQAPVEASVKTREIVDRALDATITLSTRELLASSPEARKHFKEIVGNKKVAFTVAEPDSLDTYLTTFSGNHSLDVDLHKYDENAAAAHSLLLRVIHPTFAPGFNPECILDGGAQAVIIRRDVWERLQTPVATDRRMKMESANSGTTLTVGVVENHPVRLGPITIYLQLQVVDDAPFQVLLGRPFFDVVSCSEVSEQGGKHSLRVKDPRDGNSYMIATYPRFHKTPRLNFQG